MALSVKWQRLVEDSETCDRCSSTEDELEGAVEALRSSLGIDVELKKEELTKKEFEQNPRESNLITINDRPLEDWFGGEVVESECCGVCGDEECRTVIVNGREYEEIPSDLIVKAGLAAASQIKRSNESCCSGSSDCSTGCCG